MTDGECIMSIRRQAGLTQKDLADRLGVTQVMISKWESGTRNPTAKTMRRIFDALGVQVDFGLLDDLRQCVQDAREALYRLDGAYRMMNYLLTVVEMRIGDEKTEGEWRNE